MNTSWLKATMIVLVAAMMGGCTAGAQLSVLRPAVLNARQFGGTMSVGPFDGHPMAAAAIAQDLRQRIMTAEGSPVTLVEGAGALVITGSVIDYSYSERMEQDRETCSRTETNANGESRRIEYACIEYTRRGHAHVAIAFNVTVSATGQTIIASTYEDQASRTRTATDEQPAHIDGAGLLARLRDGLVEQFARVILPWRETVRVRLGRCGDARQHCDPGIQAFRASDFHTAAAAFQRAVTQLEGMEEPPADDLADAWWNLALSLEYSGDWGRAEQAIGEAARYEPDNEAFAQELQNVRRMAEEARRLNEQGVTSD